MNYSNPTLARLLAKENVSVQHGNYKTAWFDIKNRTLGLPMWKDKGKDVYDLLVGHEVGHALYTPFEGWHDSPEKLEGCPRSYINVIEDARIERLVRNTYPGLVGPFSRGYKVLVEDGFFGKLDDLDYDKVKLIDKLNLQCKLDRDIEVPMNEEELSFYARALSTESFEEVVELCRDILAYTKENQSELLDPPPVVIPPEGINIPSNEEGDEPPQGHDDYEAPVADEEETDSSGGSVSDDIHDEPEEGKAKDSNEDKKSEDETDKESDSKVTNGKPEFTEEDNSLTDRIFRDAERKLLDLDDRGAQKTLGRAPAKNILKNIITPFDQLMKEREFVMKHGPSYSSGGVDNYTAWNREEQGILEGFDEYIKEVKKSSNFAVKEFELHKAAFQWQRAQTAKTGSLDMNKVHSYKFNEDIFKRVTRLADAKNHGMIMMIDYSGSMSRTIGTVIDQLIHLITFCKMVNIPFDVYAFTTMGNTENIPEDIRKPNKIVYKDGDIDFSNTSLPLLISSSLKKAQYIEALKFLFMKKRCCEEYFKRWEDRMNGKDWYDQYFMSPSEHWGSTPLNHALILAHYMVKDFRIKHNIDKMNLIILSDGDSNALNMVDDENLKDLKINRGYRYYGAVKLIVDGKTLDLEDRGRRATRQLAANISKRYGVKTLGFFVSDDNHDWRNKLYEINTERNYKKGPSYDSEIWKKANKEYNKNKCVVMKNALGYDELYLVKGGSKLSATDPEFEVSEEASNVQIRNAFKKFSKTKKLNKVLMTSLGKAVA